MKCIPKHAYTFMGHLSKQITHITRVMITYKRKIVFYNERSKYNSSLSTTTTTIIISIITMKQIVVPVVVVIVRVVAIIIVVVHP
jgi:hypothetical protein